MTMPYPLLPRTALLKANSAFKTSLTALCLAAMSGVAYGGEPASPEVFQGQVQVLAQAGAACVNPGATPQNLPVWAVWQDGQWWLWGDMAPVRVQQRAGERGLADLLPWASDTPLGKLEWDPQQVAGPGETRSALPTAARWQEHDNPKSCTFREARLTLWADSSKGQTAPGDAANGSTPQALLEHQSLLLRTLRLQADLQKAQSPTQAVPLLNQLHALARQGSSLPGPSRDRNLALAWLEAGERASMLRQHLQAIELIRFAHSVYEPYARQSAGGLQDSALALSSLARAQLRAGQAVAAQQTLSQAIGMLVHHQGTQTAAAASLYNQQGALLLRGQRAKEALESFAQAVSADEARNAPVIERVATLLNSASALEDLKFRDAARKVYEQCLQLLGLAPQQPDAERLLQLVQQRLHALSLPDSAQSQSL